MQAIGPPSQKDSLSQTYPELVAQWHPTGNGALTLDQITPGSNRKIWWLCTTKEPSHAWQATPHSRIYNRTKRKNTGRR